MFSAGSSVPCGESPRTPSGPEGSSGKGCLSGAMGLLSSLQRALFAENTRYRPIDPSQYLSIQCMSLTKFMAAFVGSTKF